MKPHRSRTHMCRFVFRDLLIVVAFALVHLAGCGCGSPDAKPMDEVNESDAAKSDGVVAPELGIQDVARDVRSEESTVDAPADAGGDPTCMPQAEGGLCVKPDPLIFGISLLGDAHYLDAEISNLGLRNIRVTSISLKSRFFRLVEIPRLPLELPSCAKTGIRIELLDVEVSREHGSKVLVVYETESGQPATAEFPVAGIVVRPEENYCQLGLLRKPAPFQTGIADTSQIRLVNQGTSTCLIDEVGVADCKMDKNGIIRCPSPDEALSGSVFRVMKGTLMPDGSIPPIASTELRAFVISYEPAQNTPTDLPYYGMFYVKARELTTNRTSDFPEPQTLVDGSQNYEWHAILKAD